MSFYNDYLKMIEETQSDLARQAVLTAQEIINDSIDQVPADTGDLRRSGSFGRAEINKNNIEVGFGFSSEYAIDQHENLHWHVSEQPIKGRTFNDYSQNGKRSGEHEKYWSGYRFARKLGVAKKYVAKFLENTILINSKEYRKLLNV